MSRKYKGAKWGYDASLIRLRGPTQPHFLFSPPTSNPLSHPHTYQGRYSIVSPTFIHVAQHSTSQSPPPNQSPVPTPNQLAQITAERQLKQSERKRPVVHFIKARLIKENILCRLYRFCFSSILHTRKGKKKRPKPDAHKRQVYPFAHARLQGPCREGKDDGQPHGHRVHQRD